MSVQSLWNDFGSIDPQLESGRNASPFWGTLEAGTHDAFQMMAGAGWALANRIGNQDITNWMEEAALAEGGYAKEAISEMPIGARQLRNDPISLENFSIDRLLAQTLRIAPTVVGGAAATALGGLPGAAVFGGAMTTGDAMTSLIEAMDTMTPEEMAANPILSQYKMQGMSDEDIKNLFRTEVIGNKDIAAFAAGAGLSLIAPETLAVRAIGGHKFLPGIGRLTGAGVGGVLGAGSEGAEEFVPARIQNIASRQTAGAIPETSELGAVVTGAMLGLTPGVVAGGLSSSGKAKPWEVVPPGELDQNKQAALLALPPPAGGPIQQGGNVPPQPQIGGPPAVPQIAPPVPGETIMQPGRTAQPTMIRDRNARPPAPVTPDVIPQPGQVGPVPAIAPPGGRPAETSATEVMTTPNTPVPPTMTPEEVEQSVEDYRQNAIQNGAPEGPELDNQVELYRNDLLAQLEEEAGQFQTRPGAIPEEPNLTAPVILREQTRRFLNENGVTDEQIARLSPEQIVDLIVQLAGDQFRLAGATPDQVEQQLAMVREQATDEIVRGIPVEEGEGPVIDGEVIPEAIPTSPQAPEEAIPTAQAAPPARPPRVRAPTPTPEIVVPEPPPEERAKPTVIADAPVPQLSPEAAAASQRIITAASEQEQAQEAARAGPPIVIRERTMQELYEPLPGEARAAAEEGPITVGIPEGLGMREMPEGMTVRRGGMSIIEQQREAAGRGQETKEESDLRKELNARYPEFANRTDLSVKDIVKRVEEDPVEAADVLSKNPPVPGEYAQEKGRRVVPQQFVKRLEQIMKEAKARDITMPKYVTKTTPDALVWLADVQRTLKQLHKSLTSEKSIQIFGQYIGNETAALDGDFTEMRGSFGRGADIGGTTPGGGGPIETLAGGMQAANEREAELAEIEAALAEEEGEAAPEAQPIVQTYDPGSARQPITTTDPYIYVRDEETGEVKRVRNPVSEGYTVEATEEEKQRLATEVAARAADLQAQRDRMRMTRATTDVKGQKSGRSGKGVSAVSEEEYKISPGRKISKEKLKEALPEGAKPMTKKARAAAKEELRKSKEELERRMAQYHENVTTQEKPAAEQPKEETPKERIARVRAKREAEREQKRIAAQQAKERKARKKEEPPVKETFEEKRARIFAEIAARRETGTSSASISGGRTPFDPYAAARQAQNNTAYAHKEGAVNFFGSWIMPKETFTVREAIERVRAKAVLRKGEFANAHDKLVDNILQMLERTRPDMMVYVLDEADMETAGGHSPRMRTKTQGFFSHPDTFGSPHPNTGFIGIKTGLLNDTLLAHEGIHAITHDMLDTFPALRKQLEQILAHILIEKPVGPRGSKFPEADQYYGLENIKEMLSEISTYDFAELLHNTTIPRSMAKAMGLESWRKATGWNAFVATIRKYFNELLEMMGLQPINDFNAFDAVLSTIERASHTYDTKALAGYQQRMAKEGTPLVDPDFMHVEAEFRRARERVQALDRIRPKRDPASLRRPPTSSPRAGSINAQSAVNLAREAARSASYAPSAFQKFGMHLRSGDNIMRQFEHLFPTGMLRKAYSAYMRRYTQAQQMHGVDAKFMDEKNNLFRKYAGKNIGNVSAKEYYEEVLHDQSNWNVDASIPLDQNTWLYDKTGTKVTLRSIISAKMHPELKRQYDKLAREAPELARFMKREFQFYKDKHQRMVDGILTNHIRDATRGTGNPLGAQAALALGRRIMSDTATPADVAAVGQRNYKRIRATPEFRAQAGPYMPQTRYGDHVVSAKIHIADPTSGQWRKAISPRGDITIFYGPDAEKQAIKYASNREEYSEVKTVWTDANGRLTDATGERYTSKDVITGAVKSYQVLIQDNHTEFFESAKAADDAAAELRKDKYYKSVKGRRLRAQTGTTPGQELAGSHQLQSIMKEMEAHDPFDGLPTQVKREATAAIQQAIHRATPGTSISKRRMTRKHVAGASRDSLRVMHSYSMQANNYIAGVETAFEMQDAFKEANDYAKAGYGVTDRANVTAQVVMNELNERRNAQAGIHGNVGPIVNFLTGLQFTDKLASPGYSITNMTQTPLITLPTLAKTHGLFNAGRALTKAMHDIGFLQIGKMASSQSWDAIRNRLGSAVSYHDFVTKNNPAIKGNRKAMLDKLVEYGTLDPDAGFEATKIDANKGGAPVKLLKRVEEIFRQFPRGVEAMNRYGSALAAYDLAIKKGKSHDAAVEHARDIVDSTQFNYSPANVSPYFNTRYGNVGLQFAKYGTFMYQLLGAQVSNAFGPNSTRAERIEGLKGLSFLIGAHFMMAGFGGLPTEPVRALFTVLNMFGVPVDWNDVEDYVREVSADMLGADVGEVFARGLPRAVGLDFSTRTSLSDLLVSRPPEDFDDRQNIGAYLWQLTGGPTGSSITEMGTGVKDIIDGNFGKGIGAILPIKLFSDIESAVRIGTTGKLTSARDVIYTYSPVEMIIRSLGIRPAGEANLSEARNMIYRRMESQNEARADLLRDFREAPVGEQWKFQPRFNEYNADKPRDQWITFSVARKFARDKEAAAKTYKKGVPVTKGNAQIIEDAIRTFGP